MSPDHREAAGASARCQDGNATDSASSDVYWRTGRNYLTGAVNDRRPEPHDYGAVAAHENARGRPAGASSRANSGAKPLSRSRPPDARPSASEPGVGRRSGLGNPSDVVRPHQGGNQRPDGGTGPLLRGANAAPAHGTVARLWHGANLLREHRGDG